jgi:uncharacterized protein YfiM (DUF2279 family)
MRLSFPRAPGRGVIGGLVTASILVLTLAQPVAASPHTDHRAGRNPQGPVKKVESGTAALTTVGISRDTIYNRAQYWVSQNVPYSQFAYANANSAPVGPYRTDCSGFISMAWGLDSSLNTGSLPSVSTAITKEQLQKGDVLNYHSTQDPVNGSHVVMFVSWANTAHTAYTVAEEAGSTGAVQRTISYPYDQSMDGSASWVPYRYNGVAAGSGGSSALAEGTEAMLDSSGVIHLFSVKADNHLWQAIYTSTGWTWQDLGAALTGTPGVTYRTSTGRYDVFATGTNGQLYQNMYQSGAWSGWNTFGDFHNAGFAGGVEAMLDGSGVIHLFATKTDNHMWHAIYTSTGWTWQDLGAALTGTPGVTYRTSTGRYDVFATGTNGQLYQKMYVNGAWSGWNTFGDFHNAGFAGGVEAMLDGSGVIHLFATKTDNHMWHAIYTSAGWTWQDLGAAVTGTPGVTYRSSTGRYDVFDNGTNGSLYQNIYQSGAWSGWNTFGDYHNAGF